MERGIDQNQTLGSSEREGKVVLTTRSNTRLRDGRPILRFTRGMFNKLRRNLRRGSLQLPIARLATNSRKSARRQFTYHFLGS